MRSSSPMVASSFVLLLWLCSSEGGPARAQDPEPDEPHRLLLLKPPATITAPDGTSLTPTTGDVLPRGAIVAVSSGALVRVLLSPTEGSPARLLTLRAGTRWVVGGPLPEGALRDLSPAAFEDLRDGLAATAVTNVKGGGARPSIGGLRGAPDAPLRKLVLLSPRGAWSDDDVDVVWWAADDSGASGWRLSCIEVGTDRVVFHTELSATARHVRIARRDLVPSDPNAARVRWSVRVDAISSSDAAGKGGLTDTTEFQSGVDRRDRLAVALLARLDDLARDLADGPPVVLHAARGAVFMRYRQWAQALACFLAGARASEGRACVAKTALAVQSCASGVGLKLDDAEARGVALSLVEDR